MLDYKLQPKGEPMRTLKQQATDGSSGYRPRAGEPTRAEIAAVRLGAVAFCVAFWGLVIWGLCQL